MSHPEPPQPGQESSGTLKRILVLGLGLLGGSFALALQKAGCPGALWGLDNDEAHMEVALELGLVDHRWDKQSPPEAFDLVFLAVPPGQIARALEGLAPWLSPETLILDACSVKAPVVAAVQAALGQHPAFVPSHPIAGSHLTGPEAARGDLFDGATVVLTPPPGVGPGALQRGRALWESLGALVREMTPEAHDQALGLLSHLPQLLAFSYVHQVAHAQVDLSLAGTGFRDFTRLAQSSPGLWADIALANREHLLPLLRAMQAQLTALEQNLENGDRQALTDGFRQAENLRSAWQSR